MTRTPKSRWNSPGAATSGNPTIATGHSRALATLATAAAMAALLAAATPAHGGELIPSIGLTKTTEEGADTDILGGLAVRADLATVLKGEIGVQYRDEGRFNDNLKIRTWPITASLWLQPLPMFYAGGGVGWYHTTYDWVDELLAPEDETDQDFGVHLGGGFRVPLAPTVNVDLNGRYAFLGEVESEFEELDNLDPDFWTLSLGLAIGF
jgi:opacity protein-like surface antigen